MNKSIRGMNKNRKRYHAKFRHLIKARYRKSVLESMRRIINGK